jgi:macrolide-specific efflux system membrane fusion protein
MRRALKIFVVILLLAAAGGGAYWWYVDANRADPLADVITTQAVKGDIEIAVLASGTLRPSTMVAVGAQVSGRVTSLKVRLGQTVRKGDPIAQIDSHPQENALRTARASRAAVVAQLEEKRVTLAYSEDALARQAETLARHASSRIAYDEAETTVKTTRAQIAALEAQLVQADVAVDTAETNLGYTSITAPIDGTVLLIVTQEGQTVNASQSAPTIIVLGQIDRMTIRAEISEADVTRVKPGQAVYFNVLGDPSRRWDAKLQSLDPAPDLLRSDSELASSSTSSSSASSSTSTSAVYYYGRFDVPNPDGYLRTYMTAELHVVLDRATNVVLVPSSALMGPGEDGRERIQVVSADGTLVTRAVETGLDDKVNVEIKSGLTVGEHVVSSRKSGTFVKSMQMPRGPMGM